MVEEFLGDAAVAVTVAIATALVSVRLSVRQFQTQHWWERKAEVYSNLIESLTSLKLSLELWLSELYGERQLNEEKRLSVEEQYRVGAEIVRRVAAQGAFIASEEVVETVKKVVAALEFRSQDLVEEMEHSSVAVNEALDRIRVQARKDLRRQR